MRAPAVNGVRRWGCADRAAYTRQTLQTNLRPFKLSHESTLDSMCVLVLQVLVAMKAAEQAGLPTAHGPPYTIACSAA
jgi:hypothetical protein